MWLKDITMSTTFRTVDKTCFVKQDVMSAVFLPHVTIVSKSHYITCKDSCSW